jgi:oxygen-independent coproporphyrinogen-3 oxidase
MVEFSREYLANKGYKAYYLYRQADTLANLENIGYAKPGHEGIYNSFMMGETQTVLAVGAAGVTKLVHPVSGRIERIYNNKLPREYIRSFTDVIKRKEGVIQFYESSV